MPNSRLAPVHPGDILRTEFFEPRKLTSYRVAKDLGVTLPRLNDILLKKRGISIEMGLLLAHYFGTTEDFFVTLQCEYDRRTCKQKLRGRLQKLKPLAKMT